MTGLIVAIDGTGSNVHGFTLASGGERYAVVTPRDVDYGFDLAHLREHLEQRLPVTCVLERRGDELVALEIVDAP